MVKYINHWKKDFNYTYVQKIIWEGEKMANTYSMMIERIFGKIDEFMVQPKTSYINALDSLITEKVNEYFEFASIKDEQFKEKANWLINWSKTTKNEILNDIKLAILTSVIIDEKLGSIDELYQRYYRYLLIVDDEEDEEAKYEELFNTVVQIPDEVSYNLGVDQLNIGKPKFIYSSYTESKNNLTSKPSNYDYLKIA